MNSSSFSSLSSTLIARATARAMRPRPWLRSRQPTVAKSVIKPAIARQITRDSLPAWQQSNKPMLDKSTLALCAQVLEKPDLRSTQVATKHLETKIKDFRRRVFNLARHDAVLASLPPTPAAPKAPRFRSSRNDSAITCHLPKSVPAFRSALRKLGDDKTPSPFRKVRFFGGNIRLVSHVTVDLQPIRGCLKKPGQPSHHKKVHWVWGKRFARAQKGSVGFNWIGVVMRRDKHVHPNPEPIIGKIRGWTPHDDDPTCYDMTFGDTGSIGFPDTFDHYDCQQEYCFRRDHPHLYRHLEPFNPLLATADGRHGFMDKHDW